LNDLLFLSQRIPYPPNKGDKIRSYHILQHLLKTHRVHLGCFFDDPEDEKYIEPLRKLCASVNCQFIGRPQKLMRSAKALMAGTSLSEAVFFDRGMSRWVEQAIAEHRIGKMFVFCSSMAPYAICAKGQKVIDIVDVDSEKWQAYAAAGGPLMRAIYAREGRTLFSLERRAAREFDTALFVSKAEADLFVRLAPETSGHVQFMNNGVDAGYFDPQGQFLSPFGLNRSAVVFTGMMNYRPNIEAVQWFVQTILPRLRTAHSEVEFWIVGAQPTPAVIELGKETGVRVTGAVDDVRPYLAHARCVVAPLQIARGVQNKVLEALAMAKPVVATSQACEGIDLQNGKNILVADAALEFAEAVLSVLSGAHNEIGPNGRALVELNYRWTHNLEVLDRLFPQTNAAEKKT
jgi:sugar transferase (PEP-CTERM/EpsH1 system associated)